MWCMCPTRGVPVFLLEWRRAAEVLSSRELLRSLKTEVLGWMKRSLFFLKISTGSHARKQNKIAPLVTQQWKEKTTHFSNASFQSNLKHPDEFMELIRNNSSDTVRWVVLSPDDISECPEDPLLPQPYLTGTLDADSRPSWQWLRCPFPHVATVNLGLLRHNFQSSSTPGTFKNS